MLEHTGVDKSAGGLVVEEEEGKGWVWKGFPRDSGSSMDGGRQQAAIMLSLGEANGKAEGWRLIFTSTLRPDHPSKG